MVKDRTVELNLVVRIDRLIDEDIELLVRDYLQSEGLVDVTEVSRAADPMHVVDLPVRWAPSPGEVFIPDTRPSASVSAPAPLSLASLAAGLRRRRPPPPPPR